MRAHKNRIERLEQRLPGGDDDILVIRILYDGQEDSERPPLVYRTGPDGKIISRLGVDSIPEHLKKERIKLSWDDIE